jgi:atypical dual specificity phosphatase
MKFRQVIMPEHIPGALYLHSMPGIYESWNTFLSMVEACEITHVVCLAEDLKIATKSPDYYAALKKGENAFTIQRLEIPDFGVPYDLMEFKNGIEEAARHLSEGRNILLHCGAGIGRTGLAAACLLKACGLSFKQALASVKQAGSFPETREQYHFVESFFMNAKG